MFFDLFQSVFYNNLCVFCKIEVMKKSVNWSSLFIEKQMLANNEIIIGASGHFFEHFVGEMKLEQI